jgi:MoaA/NifB/PqqE/SkfB family radical SAM enzyme
MSETNYNLTLEEKRDRLSKSKPKVLDKMLRYPELTQNNKSTAVLILNYEYICNFKCDHCSSDGLMIKTKLDYQKSLLRKHLRPPEVKTLFDRAHELGLAQVAISGGEPLSYPDFDKMIESIGPERFWIATDTNGWLLEKKAKHLKEIGLDKVQISLDSFNKDEHDTFRKQKGSYDRIMKGIDAVKAVGLDLLLLTCVTRQRVYSDEFIQFLEFAKKSEVRVYVTLAKPIGAWAGNMDVVCGDEDIRHLDTLKEKYGILTRFYSDNSVDLGCIAVKRNITITKYGDVMPCPYIQTSLGNIFDEDLGDILDRGLAIRHFSHGTNRTCISGNRDHEFVKKYMPKIWTSKEPVPYNKVFDKNDFISEKAAKKWLRPET